MTGCQLIGVVAAVVISAAGWRMQHRADRLPKQQKPRTDVPGLRHDGEELDPWERAELMDIELGYRRTAREPQYRDRSGS